MKKAKEYAQEYIDNPSLDTLRDILIEFWKEVAALEDVRKITTFDAQIAVLEEQDRKWRAFCNLIPENVSPTPSEEGFLNVIKRVDPDTFVRFQHRKSTLRRLRR